MFVTVIDLYLENAPSHQWIPTLNVPVHLLSVTDYHSLTAGFVNVRDERIHDPNPVSLDYSGVRLERATTTCYTKKMAH